MLLFILGFYGMSSLYMLSNFKSKTVILPNDQFNSNLTKMNTAFEIGAVTRLTNDYSIFDFQVIDHNSVILQSMDRSLNRSLGRFKISVLHLDNNKLVDIDENVLYGFALSPNGKNLIYVKNQNMDSFSYVYNLQSNKLKKVSYGDSYGINFISNENFIGFSNGYLTLTNVVTGKIRQLINDTQLTEIFQSPTQLTNTLYFSKNKVYFLAFNNSGPGIFEMDIKNTNKVVKVAQGEEINKFVILKNGDLLVQGKFEKKEGLFLYNKATHKFKLLQEGVITDFALNSDESRIAYFVVKDNGVGDLHTAYLDNGSLSSDTAIYRNINSVRTMKWAQDDLFICTNQLNKSEVYRFTFK